MADPERRFYRAARVTNAAMDGWLLDHAVGVANGKIIDVLPAGDAPMLETVDLGDVSLLPGLVEGHTHIPCPPRVDAFDIISVEPNEPALMRAAHAVGPGAALGDHDDARPGFEERGRLCRARCDRIGRDSWAAVARFGRADHADDGPLLVLGRRGRHTRIGAGMMAQTHVDQGADVLKVMASGGNFTPTSNPRDRQYPPETIREIVEAGASGGIEVAAHTHAAEGIRAAVEGGVRHLIHCRWLSANPEEGFRYEPELAQRIADEGIWVNPTIGLGLLASEARERGDAAPRRNPNLQGPSPREQGLEILRDMRDRGVRFTSGLDMGMAYADFNRAPAESLGLRAGGWAVGVAGAADHDLRDGGRDWRGWSGWSDPDWLRGGPGCVRR